MKKLNQTWFFVLGNTHLYCQRAGDSSIEELRHYQYDFCFIRDWLEKQLTYFGVPESIVICSSMNCYRSDWDLFWEEVGLSSSYWIDKHFFPKIMDQRVAAIHTLGSDRLLSVWKLLSYDRDTIVIDAGTACSLDCVVDGSHQGGIIFPGIRLLHQSLQSIPNLSHLDLSSHFSLKDVGNRLGQDTESAIQWGTLYTFVANLDHYIEYLESFYSRTFDVIWTGKDAQILYPLYIQYFDSKAERHLLKLRWMLDLCQEWWEAFQKDFS